ncbi:MAG TPA: molybdopterin molybdotransferase MoeA [Nitrososphaeraceae archaeon]
MHRPHSSYSSVRTGYLKLLRSINIKACSDTIDLEDSFARVLWFNVHSNTNIPSRNCSHMDGFAVRYVDIKECSRSHSVTLNVISETGFGIKKDRNLIKGQSAKIATGKPLPYGADTIIPLECAKFDVKERRINISSSFPKGSFVSIAGTEIKRNTLLLRRLHIIRAQDIGLLSLLGIRKLKVFKKPIVGLIPTGSELTDEFDNIKQGKILNTNSKVLSRLIEASGGLSLDLGITPDNVEEIQAKIKQALTYCDIVLTTGGSSIGDKDLVAESINAIGNPGIIVHGVRLDRGRVTGLAALRRKPIIILPGPIQGAVNAFIIFAQPLIRYMLGLPSNTKPLIIAKLMQDWNARKRYQNFTKILYVKLRLLRSGQFSALPVVGETTNITVLTRTNGFILVPERISTLKKGQLVKIRILPGSSFSSGTP